MDGPARLADDRPAGETVGEVVYARLRADILFGRLAPGERLRLDVASRRYGASVGTMRELLSRLASEGLVTAEGQRGFQVAPASPSEFREVAALRLLLEGHAVALAFAAGDLDWEAQVVAAHHKLAVLEGRMQAGQGGDLAPLRAADRDFHRALVAACGSRVLIDTYASVLDRYLRYLTIAVAFRGDISVREHADLLACALARDAGRAAEILASHIGSCVDHALIQTPPAWESAPAPRRPTPRPDGAMQPRRKRTGETGKRRA